MNWLELDRQHCWHPFTQAHTAAPPLNIVRAKGAYLFDEHGRSYLDAISSWWVNIHGHAHPSIADAIARQAHTLEHVMFGGITHPPAISLAQQLTARLPPPLQYVFYSDNGATAVEIALKMAAQYWHNQGMPRRRFLAFHGAYHGDTFGAMAAGKTSGFYTPFTDWLFAVDFLPYPASWHGHAPEDVEKQTLQCLDDYLVQHATELVAFILEPLIQGAAGMRMARPDFLRLVVRRVQEAGIPVIFDEVMTGFGRTGSFFAAEQLQLAPDIICLSKGLTAGFLPMGATVAQPHIYEAFLHDDLGKALLHGHSYTANPLGCAAALASLQVFAAEDTMSHVQQITTTQGVLLANLAAHPLVQRARQCGTVCAFDLVVGPKKAPAYARGKIPDQILAMNLAQALREYMCAHGVLLRPLGTTVYLLPPYCITVGELVEVYRTLHAALEYLTAHPYQWQSTASDSC
jgi:adenosylmethionine---8-amino-7-oxononanoate aminotransferase